MGKESNREYARIIYEGIKDIDIWPSYMIDYFESRDQEFLKEIYSISVEECISLESFIGTPSSLLGFIEDSTFCLNTFMCEIDRLTEELQVYRIFEILTPKNYIIPEIFRSYDFVNQLVNKYIKKATSSKDFRAVGNFVFLNCKDESLATEMYKKSHAEAESFDDFRDLGWCLGFYFKDPVWASEVLLECTGKIENNEQAGLLLSCANGIDMGDSLFADIQRKCI